MEEEIQDMQRVLGEMKKKENGNGKRINTVRC